MNDSTSSGMTLEDGVEFFLPSRMLFFVTLPSFFANIMTVARV